jgi:antagonist of KipI
MGVRLESSSPVAHEISLKSEPTDVGAVQLPPSGNPIILGPDGPTIGGYPRVAWVVEEDLPMVAQLAPGQPVTFLEASMNAVCDKRAERDRLLKMVRYQALS